MRTREETLAYGRGYNTGSRGGWPEHRPPVPPNPLFEQLLQAATRLRDEADDCCATLYDDDDDFVRRLSPKIDALDDALRQLSHWLKAAPEET